MMQKMVRVAVIFVLLICGCTGMFSSESATSIIGCIFYGDCDYYPGYYQFVVFEGAEDSPIHSLVGSWTHRSANPEHYYVLNINTDQTLVLQHYINSQEKANRIHDGRFEITGDRITIMMNNGTRSVVTFIRKDNLLYMALPDLR